MFRDNIWDGRNSARTFIGACLAVLGSIGVFLGRVLQACVSQRREYLADATAVAFTRDPRGLANALRKIAATSTGSKIEDEHAEEARHMYFAEASGRDAQLFDTHPPIFDRIRALDPDFDPETDSILAMDDEAILRETRKGLLQEDMPTGMSRSGE